MFITWSPCHLLPYDLGLMLWVLVEQQMSCLQSKASLSPLGRGPGFYSDIPVLGEWRGH